MVFFFLWFFFIEIAYLICTLGLLW